MIIQCATCSGRGWMPVLNPVVRQYYRAFRVVELGQARIYTDREPCPKCHGCGISLKDLPRRTRRK